MSVAGHDGLDLLLRDLDRRQSGSLHLRRHDRLAVARAPAAVQSLGELLMDEAANTHWHTELLSELHAERDVLVHQAQREAGLIELAGQESVTDYLEGAHP